jgi:flagellar assembly factor FliW
MLLDGTRFGSVTVDGDATIEVPHGLIGFPRERRFVLLAPQPGSPLAWLQSIDTPSLAFPVLDGTTAPEGYPGTSLRELARAAGLDGEEVSLLLVAIVRANDPTMSVNLLAPIVIDVATRRAAQVVLDARRWDARARVPRPERSSRPSQGI